MNSKAEAFQPKSNTPPVGLFNTIRFYIRLLVDLQVLSGWRHIKKFINKTHGDFLDVGCGESPYRYLIKESQTNYWGLDIADAEDKFNYKRSDIYQFDGQHIPFEAEKFDFILCTEVLEHVENYQQLVDEIYRVLKPKGEALITIPWSARYHYIPYDYFRYTPSTLSKMFQHFSDIEIIPRGTDVTSISSKIIVLFVRNLMPQKAVNYLFIPFWFIATPILGLAILMGQISLITSFGNDSDPLGYTILVKK